MQFPSSITRVSIKSSNLFSRWSVSGRWRRWLWIGLLIAGLSAGGYVYQRNSTLDKARDRDLEVRLDFIPFVPRREFRDSLWLTLRGDGKVRIVHHRLEMFVDAVYEGTLPPANAMSLVSRAKQAQSEWKLFAKGRLAGRDDSLFRMVVLPAGSADEKDVFGGQLGDATENTRSLVEDLLVLWNRLEKVSAAEAYLRSVPFHEEELKRIRQNEELRVMSVQQFPAGLQQLLIDSLNHPRDFVGISRAQYDQLVEYKQFVVSANNSIYRLGRLLPTPRDAVRQSP